MVSMQQVSTLFHLHILSLILKYLILEGSESLYCVCLSICLSHLRSVVSAERTSNKCYVQSHVFCTSSIFNLFYCLLDRFKNLLISYLHFVRYLNFRIKARIHQSYISKWADIDEIIFYVWLRFSWKCDGKVRTIFLWKLKV